jgi:hypothetical protein
MEPDSSGAYQVVSEKPESTVKSVNHPCIRVR